MAKNKNNKTSQKKPHGQNPRTDNDQLGENAGEGRYQAQGKKG